MTEDKYRPTNATVEGQMISVAGGLGRNRATKALAWVWLLGLLGVGAFLLWAVFIAS
jgi:hypothetical protein